MTQSKSIGNRIYAAGGISGGVSGSGLGGPGGSLIGSSGRSPGAGGISLGTGFGGGRPEKAHLERPVPVGQAIDIFGGEIDRLGQHPRPPVDTPRASGFTGASFVMGTAGSPPCFSEA
jgi:hypothetical protein